MTAQLDGARRDRQRGFALLVLLGIIGVGSLAVVMAVEAFLPHLRDREAVAADNLETAARAARAAYRATGAFPADLDGVAVAGGAEVEGAWRRDPFGAGEELDYGLVGSDARLRSRGGDGRLGGVDDTTIAVVGETQLRVRQRLRLRMLRAVLLRSQFRWDSAMTPGDVARMRAAMRDLAVAKRQWLGADAATRADLTTRMNAATTTIEGLVSAYGLPPIPSSLTGAGGLMSQLSMPDARAVDGAGAALLRDAVLGFVAAGADRNGGTDDDM